MSITDRVYAELADGPATLTDLRVLMPELTRLQINGALYYLRRSGRINAKDERVKTANTRGYAPRLYERPGWDA